MKIAYIYQSTGTNFAEPFAVQLHIYHQIKGFQQAGHEIGFLSLHGRQIIWTNNLRVFHEKDVPAADLGKLGFTGTKIFRLIESAVRRLQKELHFPYLALFDSWRIYDACRQNLRQVDMIHERYNLLAFGGALASRRLKKPYVLEVNADLLEERQAQGSRVSGLRRFFARLTTRFCFDSARKIICVSKPLKDHLILKWKVNPEKIAVLPNAADTEEFGRRYEELEIKKRYGLNGEPVVMFIGGFYLWHDLELLIHSFKCVLEEVPDARLVLVGDGRTRPVVEKLVLDSGLQQQVVMAGPVDHRQVPELLAMACVAVAPTITFFDGHGGSPLKIFEYMAAGKAIVATRTGQVAQLIQNGQNGILVDAGDVKGFAGAIISLLKNPQTRVQLGRQARQQAVDQHSWKHYTGRLERIYTNIISNEENKGRALV